MSEPHETSPGDHPAPSSGASYEVIARRYRPRTFDEVVGQEAIAETLRQAILQERLGHAFLFCGPRGVGKTSMARIFARALQCPSAENGDPCGRCAICDRIFRGEDIDVVEMDGASHRGIDDVRELIQHVRYAPTEGPYRIFIIDEVHMLTREAFNSLLKTLEEPPPHVKFVFATTEPEKVIPTVLSRCQRFDFSPISPADIVKRLGQICGQEGATPEEGLLERIAGLARGGMRDSQSLLDQLLSFSGASPTNADLDRITGRLAPDEVETLLDLVERGARAEVVTRLDEFARGGTDPAVLLEQVIEALRDRLHAGVAAGWQDADVDRNLLAQEILQEARARVRRLGRADLVLELALLRLSTLVDLVPLSRWQDAVGGDAPPAPVRTPAPRPAATPAEPTPDPPTAEAPRPAPPPQNPKAQTPEAQTPEEPTPEEPISGEPTSGATPAAPEHAEPPAASGGVASLRAAVETRSGGRARRRKEPDPAPTPEVDRSDPRAVLGMVVERISPSLLRVMGEQYELRREGDGWTLLLGESALGIVGERREALRRELGRELGGPVRIELGTFESEPLPEERPALDDTIPAIVEKAREIFRGELFRGGPSPGR